MIQEISPQKIHPNAFNPNVMPHDLYNNLRQRMIAEGPMGIDPILVSPAGVFYGKAGLADEYVAVDGYHRWKLSVELKWDAIRCDVQNLTEDQAKQVSYSRNKLRGTMDPFREAALFQSMLKDLETQENVAEYFGVDRTLVANRLSLLKLPDEVKALSSKVPRGTLSTSHLEAISSVPDKNVQKELAKETVERDMNMRELERRVSWEKEKIAKEAKFRKAVEESEHKACPVCKGQAVREHWRRIPWVLCEKNHEWDLKTGECPDLAEAERRRKIEAGEKVERELVPQSFRYIDDEKTLREKLSRRTVQLLRTLESVRNLRIAGTVKIDGELKDISIDFERSNYSENIVKHDPNRLEWGLWGNGRLTLNWEGKEYKKYPEKTLIYVFGNSTKKTAEAAFARVKEFLDKLKLGA